MAVVLTLKVVGCVRGGAIMIPQLGARLFNGDKIHARPELAKQLRDRFGKNLEAEGDYHEDAGVAADTFAARLDVAPQGLAPKPEAPVVDHSMQGVIDAHASPETARTPAEPVEPKAPAEAPGAPPAPEAPAPTPEPPAAPEAKPEAPAAQPAPAGTTVSRAKTKPRAPQPT